MEHRISQNIIRSTPSGLGDSSEFSQTRLLIHAARTELNEDRFRDNCERHIVDFVSERDLFIQKHKRKHRLIFTLGNQGENINVVEINQLSL